MLLFGGLPMVFGLEASVGVRFDVWEGAQAWLLDGAAEEQRSLLVAYVLLMVGGMWGLHYTYLGDDEMARKYRQTLGYCFLGVLLDVCRLPMLVADANVRLAHDLEKLPGRRLRWPSPKSVVTRRAGDT